MTGSALQEDNANPRDWDLRVVLPDALFADHFYDAERWAWEEMHGIYSEDTWRYFDELKKRNHQGREQTRLRIELKVLPESYWAKYATHAHVRLDTRGVDWNVKEATPEDR